MKKKSKAQKLDKTIEETKKQKKEEGIGKDKILVISIVLIALAFWGLFSLIKQQAKNPDQIVEIKTYNGFVFEKEGNIWKTEISIINKLTGKGESYSILFHYTPDEVENITTEKNTRNISVTPNLFLNIPTVYIALDPYYPSASVVVMGGVEISKTMAIVSKTYDYKTKIKSAMTKPGNYSFPIATCDNITATQRVIYLKLGNETKIDFQNGCVIVQGTDETEILRASERLAFEILRIL